MATKKVNKNIDFLVDEHGNLVGSRNPKSQTSTDPTYGDAMLVTAKENLVTGGIEFTVGGELVDVGGAVATISGTPQVGQTLTATLGANWSATGYQWTRDGVAISGATSATYVTQGADIGASIQCTVSGLSNKVAGVTIQGAVYTPTVPVLQDSFESLAGWTISGNGTLGQDTTNAVVGSARLQISGSGVTGQTPIATKTSAISSDPSTWGTIVTNLRQHRASQQVGPYLQVGRSGTYSQSMLPPSTEFAARSVVENVWQAVHVSELTGMPSGPGIIDFRFRQSQYSPFDATTSIDGFYTNAAGRPTVCITFDDNEDTTHDVALPYMSSRGMQGTAYIASGIVGQSNGMTLPKIQALHAAGWTVGCDGTPDDSSMVLAANPAAAYTQLKIVQDYLVANGMPNGIGHICYPFGTWTVEATPTNVAAMTGNGTTTVTFGASATVTAGQTVYGKNVPAGTVVVTGGAGVTTAVLSNPIPVQTFAAKFIDESGPYFGDKLPASLKANGVLTARTTLGEPIYTRFGLEGTQWLRMNGNGVTGATLAQMIAKIETAILRGLTIVFYLHRITIEGGSINISTADFTGLMDYLKTKKDAGLLDVMTIGQLYARDGAALPPG